MSRYIPVITKEYSRKISVDAVSYTHLDVYKRQAMRRSYSIIFLKMREPSTNLSEGTLPAEYARP